MTVTPEPRVRGRKERRGVRAAEALETVERSRGQAFTGICILVVDDDEDMRTALQHLFECYGAAVTTAASAAEALECSRPDVLLSDIAMAAESGYDLMRKIAARESGGTLPAAALSAYSRQEDRA